MDGKIPKITLRPQHWHNTVRWFKKSRKWKENKETSHRILKEEAKHDTFLSTEAWGAEAANGLLNPSLSSVLSQRFLWNELLTDSISMFDYSEFWKILGKDMYSQFYTWPEPISWCKKFPYSRGSLGGCCLEHSSRPKWYTSLGSWSGNVMKCHEMSKVFLLFSGFMMLCQKKSGDG